MGGRIVRSPAPECRGVPEQGSIVKSFERPLVRPQRCMNAVHQWEGFLRCQEPCSWMTKVCFWPNKLNVIRLLCRPFHAAALHSVLQGQPVLWTHQPSHEAQRLHFRPAQVSSSRLLHAPRCSTNSALCPMSVQDTLVFGCVSVH